MVQKPFVLFVCLFVFVTIIYLITEHIFPFTNSNESGITFIKKNGPKQFSDKNATYTLELDYWNIYNDGTNPVETTNGINAALKWAFENNITKIIVPEGKYLIDKDNRINMVSNITFELNNNAFLQKESNGYERYELLYIGPGVNNVTLTGGTYKGDRYTHDFSKKDNSHSSGTHENGYGILAEGAVNLTIDNVKVVNFTGDGLCIGGNAQHIVNLLDKEGDFELGAIDGNGKLIDDTTKIRTKNINKTNFSHPIFKEQRAIQFSRPENISHDILFDIFFYASDGTFLSNTGKREIGWDMVSVPIEADYYYAVFDTHDHADIYLEYWNKTVSKEISVENSEFAFNRRQGITVGGVDQILIENNDIHSMEGTMPQSGIDVEAGFFPNTNIKIKNNKIYNNASYNIILYDGQDVLIENNYLGPNASSSSIGVAVSSSFRSGAIIQNNVFDGSSIVSYEGAIFKENKMSNSLASFIGPNVIIDGLELTDSPLHIKSIEPYGIKASNINIYNNKQKETALVINDKPVHLKNVTMYGETTLRNLIGNTLDGSVFDNLKVIGYNSVYGIDLPRGTYNNCVFEAADGGSGSIQINSSGKYMFQGCLFKTNKRGLEIAENTIEVIIKDSTFDILESGEAIYVEAAKKVDIRNNKINAYLDNQPSTGLIKIINNDVNEAKEVLIKGNKIRSIPESIGILTKGGMSIPSYFIEDNILYNAKLQLKENDKSINNQEIVE